MVAGLGIHIVLARDLLSFRDLHPGCAPRAQLHVHDIQFRSQGGCDEFWNLTVVCTFHHRLLHKRQIGPWLDDLDVRTWWIEPLPNPEPARVST